jgi:hypothetical protein
MIGLTALSIPTVEYGGTFVLRLITGRLADVNLVGLQRTFFRAGHGHAGVLLLLSLIVLILVDQTRLPEGLRWFMRVGAPVATLLVSGGFFFSVMNETGMPSGLIALIYVGAIVMALVLVTLAIGLFRSMKEA